MEININYIHNELNIIITDNKKHTGKTVLYALAALEIISIIQNTYIIPFQFIKILNYLKNYMNFYIDFDFLLYVYENKRKVILKHNADEELEEFEQSNIFDNINDMLKKDAEILNSIINNNNTTNDEYGKIDKNVIKLSKKLFNIIDKDKDGYISALDILHLIKICNKYILVFENNFIDTMTQILIVHRKIDYYLFLENLF